MDNHATPSPLSASSPPSSSAPSYPLRSLSPRSSAPPRCRRSALTVSSHSSGSPSHEDALAMLPGLSVDGRSRLVWSACFGVVRSLRLALVAAGADLERTAWLTATFISPYQFPVTAETLNFGSSCELDMTARPADMSTQPRSSLERSPSSPSSSTASRPRIVGYQRTTSLVFSMPPRSRLRRPEALSSHRHSSHSLASPVLSFQRNAMPFLPRPKRSAGPRCEMCSSWASWLALSKS